MLSFRSPDLWRVSAGVQWTLPTPGKSGYPVGTGEDPREDTFMRAILTTTCLMLALSGCDRLGSLGGSSPLGSLGFGRATADPSQRAPLVLNSGRDSVVEGRALVEGVTNLRVDQLGSSLLLTATGMTGRQGAYNAQLTQEGVEGTTLVLAFRAERAEGTIGGPARTREVTAAVTLSRGDLAGISAIRVVGGQNAMTVRP